MNIEHKMPEAYLKHKVFDDLKYMKGFYDSISMSFLVLLQQVLME